jgi:hypothetical protein
MTSSRSAIRQAVAVAIPGALTASVGSATTTQITDTDDEQTLFTGDGGADYTGWYIVIPQAAAADQTRRIAIHKKDEGTIRVSRAWGIAPTTGWTYELWPPDMPPAVVNQAINDGIVKLPYMKEQTIPVTTRDNSYSLAAYTWLNNERQVYEVYWEYTNSNMVNREEYPWWKVFNNAGVLTLKLDPIPSTATGNTVIMESKAYYETLATDAATTTCPLGWVAAASAVELYKALRKRGTGGDVSRWQIELGEARKEFLEQTRKYAPKRGRRMIPRSPTRMTSGIRPRRGEFYY